MFYKRSSKEEDKFFHHSKMSLRRFTAGVEERGSPGLSFAAAEAWWELSLPELWTPGPWLCLLISPSPLFVFPALRDVSCPLCFKGFVLTVE